MGTPVQTTLLTCAQSRSSKPEMQTRAGRFPAADGRRSWWVWWVELPSALWLWPSWFSEKKGRDPASTTQYNLVLVNTILPPLTPGCTTPRWWTRIQSLRKSEMLSQTKGIWVPQMTSGVGRCRWMKRRQENTRKLLSPTILDLQKILSQKWLSLWT